MLSPNRALSAGFHLLKKKKIKKTNPQTQQPITRFQPEEKGLWLNLQFKKTCMQTALSGTCWDITTSLRLKTPNVLERCRSGLRQLSPFLRSQSAFWQFNSLVERYDGAEAYCCSNREKQEVHTVSGWMEEGSGSSLDTQLSQNTPLQFLHCFCRERGTGRETTL